MNPDIIIYGFILFFICLIIHIFIWRIKIPANDALALFLIFLIIPFLIFLVSIVGLKDFISGIVLTEVLLLHLSFSLIYIASYPAAQAVSPSLNILLIIGSSDKKRMTGNDIFNQCSNIRIVTDRVDDLAAYNLILKKGDYFELKPLAKFIINIFIAYRKILGLPAGGG